MKMNTITFFSIHLYNIVIIYIDIFVFFVNEFSAREPFMYA